MFASLFVFLIGLAVGSFLNVVIFRTYHKQPLGGRSQCMECQLELRPGDMIPILSYLMLKGRCRGCGAQISSQYPLVEFTTALVFVLFFIRYFYGFSLPDGLSTNMAIGYLVRDLIMTAFLVVLFVYDLKYYLLLDRFTIPAILVAFFLNLTLGFSPISLLAGMAVVGGFFLFQFVLSKGAWIGGGDVRMGLLMGALLGLRDGIVALIIAYAVGALVGILLLLSSRADWKTKVPFGTFLVISTFLVMLAGDALVGWYIELIGGPVNLLDFLDPGRPDILTEIKF